MGKKKYIGHPDCLPTDPSGKFVHGSPVYIDGYAHNFLGVDTTLKGFFTFDSYDKVLDIFWCTGYNGLTYGVPVGSVIYIHPDDFITYRFFRWTPKKVFDNYNNLVDTVSSIYYSKGFERLIPKNIGDFFAA